MATNYITSDRVIAEASTLIKNFTEQEKAMARQWVYTATRRIGLNKLDIKVSNHIPLVDFSAEKPLDLASTIDLALFDSADQEIRIRYKGRAQHDTEGSLGRAHQDIRNIALALHVTEDDTYFNVEEFTDDSPADAYFVVRYYSYPVDDDGYPKIPEVYTLAVIMYIRDMWALRERQSLGEIQEARNTWLREAAAAYGRVKTPSMLEGKEIAKGLNSMIQKTVVRDREF
jgi:hypothetical protein